MAEEYAREGNRALAKFMRRSLRTTSRLVKEMKKTGVVLRITRAKARGRGNIAVNIWFPSQVKRWLAIRQMKKMGTWEE